MNYNSCQICLLEFNDKERFPCLLPFCGHVICKSCLTLIYQRPNRQCPFDRKNLPSNVNECPKFPLLLNLLEDNFERDQGQCESHQKPLKFVCLEESILLCQDCLKKGHMDHDWRLIDEFMSEFKNIKQKVQAIVTQLNQQDAQHQRKMDKVKGEVKERLKSQTKLYFDDLINQLQAEKTEALRQIEKDFDSPDFVYGNLLDEDQKKQTLDFAKWKMDATLHLHEKPHKDTKVQSILNLNKLYNNIDKKKVQEWCNGVKVEKQAAELFSSAKVKLDRSIEEKVFNCFAYDGVKRDQGQFAKNVQENQKQAQNGEMVKALMQFFGDNEQKIRTILQSKQNVQ